MNERIKELTEQADEYTWDQYEDKTTYPDPDRQKGQRSIELPEIYFNRILPQFIKPIFTIHVVDYVVENPQEAAGVAQKFIVNNRKALAVTALTAYITYINYVLN